MLNKNTVSVKTIIAKIYRDLQLTEEENFVDYIEWCAEALDFIHVYPQYTHHKQCIQVSNHKGELPCDYIQLESLEYKGTSLRYSTGSFGPRDTTKTVEYLTPYSFNQDKIKNVLLLDGTNIIEGLDSFSISNGYIKTSFREGKINILYVAMELDEEGYPLIPDHQSFKEALYWYCVYKYLYAKVLRGEIQAQLYTDAYQKWLWYCNQSGAEALMPDLITLENIKRSYLSLRPRPNMASNFFNELNKP